MCGRFTITEFAGIEERFDLAPIGQELKPRYNVAPSQDIPVIINDGVNRLASYKWGLIPYWAKDPAIGSKLINARAETLSEKPSFRCALQRQRCLIVADGFYEWKKVGPVKQPYRITLKSGELFAFAGLWDTWKSPNDGLIKSCTIITTTPNELMQPLHDRMPVILTKELEKLWLDQSITDSRYLMNYLQPYPANLMIAHEVSTLVNSPRNDLPECIKPLA